MFQSLKCSGVFVFARSPGFEVHSFLFCLEGLGIVTLFVCCCFLQHASVAVGRRVLPFSGLSTQNPRALRFRSVRI